VDDGGVVVPVNVVGEICIRNQALLREYYNNPEATEKAFSIGHWFKTSDMEKVTDGGKLMIEGRTSDVINRGDGGILAATVENVLKTCPGVQQVIAVGVPDEHLTEEICACVIPEPDISLTVEMIEEFSKSQFLPANLTIGLGCRPKYYLIFEMIQLTTTGKVDRRAIMSEAATRLNLKC
jgi:acyl-CoA synthetase (AMP-forming)/AMP-acid ligase II